jgi:hypothetical protein
MIEEWPGGQEQLNQDLLQLERAGMTGSWPDGQLIDNRMVN